MTLADGLAYLAHCITMRRVMAPRCIDERGFVPLNGAILQRILGSRGWPAVKRHALAIGLVECNDSYRAGERSMGYRLKPPYDGPCEWCPVTNRRLAERIARWRQQDRERWRTRCQAGNRPELQVAVEHLWRNLHRIRIDDADQIDLRLSWEVALSAEFIRQGDWRLSVDPFGRVHTNVSNLKRELRQHLSVDGRRLVNLDIANSQPLFLALHTLRGERRRGGGERRRKEPYVLQIPSAKLCTANDGPAELREFLSACERGEFYGSVAACLDCGFDYDTLKRRVLAALFDRPSHRNRVQEAIGRAFPGVLEALARLKQGDYRRAAHLAQRLESRLVIEQCVGRLARERPELLVSTIHDSILTAAGDEEVIRGVMVDEFRNLGVEPTLRVERY